MNNRCKAPEFIGHGVESPLKVILYSFLIGIGIILLFAVGANAQPQHDHSKLGVAGAFYGQWNQMPSRQQSCCDLKDCYVTLFKAEGGVTLALKRQILNGQDVYTAGAPIERESVEQALAHAQWVVIPATALEENAADPLDSPDGENHVCMSELGTVYCAVRGSGQ